MSLPAAWLVACGALALALALAVWPLRRTRWAMLAWRGREEIKVNSNSRRLAPQEA
jgi:hypothetical protein